MEEVMFVIKSLIVTVVVIVCLQIRVGQQTVEAHAMDWIHHSSISQHLQDVAEGAVKVANQGKSAVANLVGSSQAADEKTTEASTGSWFKIKRSAAYYRQKERERANHKRAANNERAGNENADESTDDNDRSADQSRD